MGKTKAHKLPTSTKLAIAKAKARNQSLTYHELADQFACSYNQVRGAVADHKAGKLSGRRGRPPSARQLAAAEGATFEQQVDKAVRALAADKNISAIERIQMLEKLAATKKTMQQIEMQGHIKRADAEIFAATVRYFRPDASDQDIIKIYHEVQATCKSSR